MDTRLIFLPYFRRAANCTRIRQITVIWKEIGFKVCLQPNSEKRLRLRNPLFFRKRERFVEEKEV